MSNTVSTENLPTEDGSGTGGQRRLLVIVGGAAVALVLALGAYFLFLSGGEEEDLGPVPSGAAAVDDSNGKDKNGKNDKDGKDGKDGKDDDVPSEVDEDFTVGRNPFAPLPAEAIKEEPAPPADDTTTDVADDGGTGPATEPAPEPTPTPTSDVASTYQVMLRSVDIGKESAVIVVDGKRYSLKIKEIFPDNATGPFKLLGVGELSSGKDTALVVFGSDTTVGLVANKPVLFSTV